MTMVFVVPATGLTVPNLDVGPDVFIDAAGENLLLTPYVQRLIDSGDVTSEAAPNGPHWSSIVMAELPGTISREAIVVASGAGELIAGTVLGKITASGKYIVSLESASDGSETAAAVLISPIDATLTDITVDAWTDWCELTADELTYGNPAEAAAKNTQLATRGIKVRA